MEASHGGGGLEKMNKYQLKSNKRRKRSQITFFDMSFGSVNGGI